MSRFTEFLARRLLRRLRRVSPKTARALKAELTQFNSRTGVWAAKPAQDVQDQPFTYPAP